jgi:hypothetical protein
MFQLIKILFIILEFLLPLLIALGYAHIKMRATENKLKFAFLSSLLTYGIVVVLAIPFLILEEVRYLFPPDELLESYNLVATVAYIAVEYIEIPALILVGLVSSFLIPMKLKKYWPILAVVKSED